MSVRRNAVVLNHTRPRGVVVSMLTKPLCLTKAETGVFALGGEDLCRNLGGWPRLLMLANTEPQMVNSNTFDELNEKRSSKSGVTANSRSWRFIVPPCSVTLCQQVSGLEGRSSSSSIQFEAHGGILPSLDPSIERQEDSKRPAILQGIIGDGQNTQPTREW